MKYIEHAIQFKYELFSSLQIIGLHMKKQYQ